MVVADPNSVEWDMDLPKAFLIVAFTCQLEKMTSDLKVVKGGDEEEREKGERRGGRGWR